MKTDTTAVVDRWRTIATWLAVLVALVATSAAPAGASEVEAYGPGPERTDVVQEWNVDGTANPDEPKVGTAQLDRRGHELVASAKLTGLIPGGVYTFWWVVVQGEGVFPGDFFVTSGDGMVVGANGKANASMTATLGQPSITGFVPDGVNEITFGPLSHTADSTVRIEIAYHGQAADAGGDLAVWLGDFWTGEACPPTTPNPNPLQPHCPVWYAATFE